jgi:glycosyltransferase involved in cell wall biosynthesis
MGYRLAVVQHGDYAEALDICASDQAEPYVGMRYSVETLERLFDTAEATLVVSLDAPRYRLRRGTRDLVGFSQPRWPKGGKIPWSWMSYQAVRGFRPTHVLVRTGGLLAAPVLNYAVARGLSALVIMAGYLMPAKHRWEAALNRRLVRLLNDPHVVLVGNHRRPAAESLVAAGVRADKVVAYDLPQFGGPSENPARSAPEKDGLHVVYAGAMKPGKGIGDLLEAVIRLNDSGYPVKLTACGEGPDLPSLRARAAGLPPGTVALPGRLPNDRVQGLMREAAVVCVPSRRESSEGLPYVVTEALTARTPLIASDHPCMTDVLRDGEGLKFFPSGDVDALARAIREVTADPATYERLSESTEAAFAKIRCDTSFHELIDRWREGW